MDKMLVMATDLASGP